jgi:hypothetical protein
MVTMVMKLWRLILKIGIIHANDGRSNNNVEFVEVDSQSRNCLIILPFDLFKEKNKLIMI